jgi:hypothetical protein
MMEQILACLLAEMNVMEERIVAKMDAHQERMGAPSPSTVCLLAKSAVLHIV